MSDWIWLAGLLLMGATGFQLGVQYAWSRDRISPFIWGICHPLHHHEDGERPWERVQ